MDTIACLTTTASLTNLSKNNKKIVHSSHINLSPSSLKSSSLPATTKNHGGSLNRKEYLRTRLKAANNRSQSWTSPSKTKPKIFPKTTEKPSFPS